MSKKKIKLEKVAGGAGISIGGKVKAGGDLSVSDTTKVTENLNINKNHHEEEVKVDAEVDMYLGL